VFQTTGSRKPWLAAVGSDLRSTQIADGAAQAGSSLCKDDRGAWGGLNQSKATQLAESII
jgi:hypothetical protein